MFIRVKGTGLYRYLQVVENHREGQRTVQRVLCTLGRVDQLMAKGATDTLLRSLARFGNQVLVLSVDARRVPEGEALLSLRLDGERLHGSQLRPVGRVHRRSAPSRNLSAATA